MTIHLHDPEEYELTRRPSTESEDSFDIEHAELLSRNRVVHKDKSTRTWSTAVRRFLWGSRHDQHRQRFGDANASRQGARSRKGQRSRFYRLPRRCRTGLQFIGVSVSFIWLIIALFWPSYTHPPEHYNVLRRRIDDTKDPGRGNPGNQQIFIAASLYDPDGTLLLGDWGNRVLSLVEILGPENVFLSIYQNEGGHTAQMSSTNFAEKVTCNHSIVYDENFDASAISSVILPDGSSRIKRMAYLAEVRNRALLPLTATHATTRFDKLLYLNDVIFNPGDAAQLLFSTNLGPEGQANYRAACAVDFINPFKFYDTFATRDAQGYSMGIPFYPWFSSAGKAASRQDVQNGRDAVRVKSCWGGMVAFDGAPFQSTTDALRFRHSNELYWEASECCLIHADLALRKESLQADDDYGIYVNPYIRVAYSASTLHWLGITRRLERIYSWPHAILNKFAGMPRFNPRRAHKAGLEVDVEVWKPAADGGSFQLQTQKARGDGFCGFKTLQVLKEDRKSGGKSWETIPVP